MFDRAGRAEILLPRSQVPGGVVFQIGVIASQPILAHAVRSGQEVGNGDPRAVAPFATHDCAAGQGIHSAKVCVIDDPTGLQGGIIGGSQCRSNWLGLNPRHGFRAECALPNGCGTESILWDYVAVVR
jgi:hypothetical protein